VSVTDSPPTGPALDVIVPVHDEERDLGACVRRLHGYLTDTFPYPFRITIADTGSTDGTMAVAEALAAESAEITVSHLDRRRRGRPGYAVGSASPAPVLAHMTVDLSTGVDALLPLVAPLIAHHPDVEAARGSDAAGDRTPGVISRCYGALLRGTLRTRLPRARHGCSPAVALARA
jgi:glycosyltransferase involved in cell wall biosynthesis